MKLTDILERVGGYGRFTLKLVHKEKEDWEHADEEDYTDDEGEFDEWGYAEAPEGKRHDKRVYQILDDQLGKQVGELEVEWTDTYGSRPYSTKGTFFGKPLPNNVAEHWNRYGNNPGQDAFRSWLKHEKYGQKWLAKNGIQL